MLSVAQHGSMAGVGSLEVVADGWLKAPGVEDDADLVHRSGIRIFDMRAACILMPPGGEPVEVATLADAMATASALLGQ